MALEKRYICFISEVEQIPINDVTPELVLQFEGELKRNTKANIETAIMHGEVEIKQKKNILG